MLSCMRGKSSLIVLFWLVAACLRADAYVTVPGDSFDWVPTGVYLDRGDIFEIVVSGSVSPNNSGRTYSPEGVTNVSLGYDAYQDQPAYALLGTIASAEGRFVVGTGGTFQAESSGELYLVFNDDYYSDNTGAFEVRIILENDGLPSDDPDSGIYSFSSTIFEDIPVTFYPYLTFSPRYFWWDVDGDGYIDAEGEDAEVVEFTFTRSGDYTVVLYAERSSSVIVEYRLAIRVFDGDEDGQIDTSPSPARGYAPLHVEFDAEELVGYKYEWDWENDGHIDSEQDDPRRGHTFETPGVYTVALYVTSYWNDYVMRAAVTVEVLDPAPSITGVTATPVEATVPAMVTYGVSASAQGSAGIVKYEWDFDGDYTVDQETTTAQAVHQYTNPGVTQAWVRVTDTSGYAVISALPQVLLSGVDVANPDAGSSVTPDAALALNHTTFIPGQTLEVRRSLDVPSEGADVYLALFLPTGQFWCLGTDWQFGEMNALQKMDTFFAAETEENRLVFQAVLPDAPDGAYTWMLVMVRSGTDILDSENWLASYRSLWRVTHP